MLCKSDEIFFIKIPSEMQANLEDKKSTYKSVHFMCRVKLK